MRLQLKTLFQIKALPIPTKNWKNLLGGGGGGGGIRDTLINGIPEIPILDVSTYFL